MAEKADVWRHIKCFILLLLYHYYYYYYYYYLMLIIVLALISGDGDRWPVMSTNMMSLPSEIIVFILKPTSFLKNS